MCNIYIYIVSVVQYIAKLSFISIIRGFSALGTGCPSSDIGAGSGTTTPLMLSCSHSCKVVDVDDGQTNNKKWWFTDKRT